MLGLFNIGGSLLWAWAEPLLQDGDEGDYGELSEGSSRGGDAKRDRARERRRLTRDHAENRTEARRSHANRRDRIPDRQQHAFRGARHHQHAPT